MNFAFSPKTKVPGLWRRLALLCPPESTPDPPHGTSSEVTLRKEEMTACLIETLLLHIHVWILGGGGAHSSSTQIKVIELRAPPFLDMGACLKCAGVHCHGKKYSNHNTVFSFVVQRFSPPVVSLPCPQKERKKTSEHLKDQCYIFCVWFW